jgi:hypothetical protein
VQGNSSNGNDKENVALAAKSKKKTKKGSKGGAKSKGERKKDMNKVKCFACHKMWHYAGQCPNKKKKQVAASAEVEEFSTKFKKEFSLLVCLSSSAASISVWYIDSGASHHMTGVHEHFTDLTKRSVNLEVVLVDGSIVKADGIGTVSFQRQSRPPKLVRDVLYVLGLKKNLISVSTIKDRGYEVVFRDGQVLMYTKGSNITSTKVIEIRHKKLYRLMFQLVRALIHSNSSSDLCELWHRRIAHLHHGALRILREIVTGVPDFNTEHQDVCKGCALGKYTKTVFPSSDNRVAGILDLIHYDVCGPMSYVSLRGYEYYVTFIDDFSRKTWPLFMEIRGQVFKRFQEFKALVENQTSKKIKVLRSNNGGEYTSNDFIDFFAKEGIKRELTIPYNPQ